jgi:uncharacterized membrane protein YjjP (DUF1212 family)
MIGDRIDPVDVVMKAAVLLHENGQSTSMTLTAVERLNRGMSVDTTLIPSWASLMLVRRGGVAPAWVAPASPSAVNMRRVASAMSVVDRAEDGPMDIDVTARDLNAAGAQPASNFLVFAAACAVGAGALAVVFGATDWLAVLLAAICAALGGFLRRALGRFGIGFLTQAFAAATVAGLVGALALHLRLGDAGLVAVCAGMVLVPGPHILNGAVDLLDLRITLGIARLGYATLVLAAIAAGLIIGLGLGGQTLTVSQPAAEVPLYADVIAAGIAAGSYPVYFSMPYRMIGWPAVVGMIAHAAHWWALTVWKVDLAVAALVACLLVGILLIPVSHLLRIPFAAIGFASIVAMVPGSYVFRMLSGLVQLPVSTSPTLLAATVSDGAVAALVVAAMAIGLVIPMHIRAALLAARETTTRPRCRIRGESRPGVLPTSTGCELL